MTWFAVNKFKKPKKMYVIYGFHNSSAKTHIIPSLSDTPTRQFAYSKFRTMWYGFLNFA